MIKNINLVIAIFVYLLKSETKNVELWTVAINFIVKTTFHEQLTKAIWWEASDIIKF